MAYVREICLYHYPRSIYTVRLVAPKRLCDLVGRWEIHASTGLPSKLAALRIQLHWRERFMALDVKKLTVSNPLLLGILISKAEQVTKLSIDTLLGEILNDRTPVYIQASN